MANNPNCYFCKDTNVVATAPIDGNPTWKCKTCGGLFAAVKVTRIQTTLGDAAKAFSQYIYMNIESGMRTEDAVYHACKTLGIRLPEDKMDNLILSIKQEQERLIEAKDLGMDVGAGQVVQQVSEDEHEDMIKKADFINDSFSVTRVK